MDPVTAFSLACGVIQVVSFSTDLLNMCRTLYKQGSLTGHADIVASAQDLKDLKSKLESQRLIKGISAVPQPVDNKLLEVAQKCSETAKKLIEEIDKLKAPRRRDAFVKAVKIAFHHQGVLDKLQAQMDGYRRTLDTYIMIDLRGRLGLVLNDQTNALQKLDKYMQDIARHLAAEPMTCDQMAMLLQNHTSALTESITQELQTLDYCNKFLASLHFPEIHSRQEEVVEAHQETFQWIFDDSDAAMRPWTNFVDWLKTDSDTYWISGKAGSGKSTLMNYIGQDERTMKALKAWAEHKDIIYPSFFFWAAGSNLQKTVAGLLRSLLYQIFEQHRDLIPSMTRGIERDRSSTAGVYEFEPIAAWTERRLIETLQRITQTISSSCYVCLFIDGLDEFEGDHYDLIEMIGKLASWPAVKCCVSSRAEWPFLNAFGSSSTLRLQDLTRSDIKRFVSAKIKAIPEMKVFLDQPEPKPRHPVDLIVKKADGVFLWVQLAVKSQIIGIRSHDDIETLWRRLEDLPTEINDLYSCMLKRISKFHEREAAQYLRLAHLLGSEASVLQIVLALHYTGNELYKKPDMSKIASEYDRATKRIDLTCAGLISCHRHEKDIAGDSPNLSSLTALDCWRHCRGAKLSWCHRTAMGFFGRNRPGATFIDIHPQYQSSYIARAHVALAELVFLSLVAMEPQSQQLHYFTSLELRLSSICGYIADAEGLDSNIKQTAIEFIHHVDKCIHHVCDWCGWTGDKFWQNLGTKEPHNVAGETATDNNSRPTDFFTFASSSGVYIHIEDRLDREGQSLSHSEIQHLAHLVGRWDNGLRWNVRTLRQLKLVTRLIQLGADANSSDGHITIWEDALHYTYEPRDFSFYLNHHRIRTELASIFEIFLQNGADPYPVVHWAQLYGSHNLFFEIDLRLSELPTYRRILEKLSTAGKVSQSTNAAPRVSPLQIHVGGFPSVKPDERYTYDLNDEIRPQIYALIDQTFHPQGEMSLDFRRQIMSQVRAILPTKR